MDNGDSFGDETDSEFSYKVRYPSELSFGLGLHNYQGFSASVSADLTNYSNTEVDFLESDFYDDERAEKDRKSTRLNSSHVAISYAVFCLKKKKKYIKPT